MNQTKRIKFVSFNFAVIATSIAWLVSAPLSALFSKLVLLLYEPKKIGFLTCFSEYLKITIPIAILTVVPLFIPIPTSSKQPRVQLSRLVYTTFFILILTILAPPTAILGNFQKFSNKLTEEEIIHQLIHRNVALSILYSITAGASLILIVINAFVHEEK